jgi:hypothetical protein
MTPRQHNGLPLNAKTAPVLETLTPTEAISTRRGVANGGESLQAPFRMPHAAAQEACP